VSIKDLPHPASQINSKDKDFRYMATSDLLNELQKETFRADGDMERRLGDAILAQLEDQSGDISGMAVKWWVAHSLPRARGAGDTH